MSNNTLDMLYDRIADLDARAADAEARVAELETALRALADNTWNIGRRPVLRYDEFARVALGERDR